MKIIKKFFFLSKNLILHRKNYLPSFPKKFNTFGSCSVIHYPSNIPDSKYISIGNNVTILPYSRIQVFNRLTGLDSHVKIGNNCYIGTNFSILAGANVEIGNEVLIASNVLITSENHGMNPEIEIPYMNQPLSCSPVKIGDGTWIGEKVSILSGVTIGKKCIIGTNAVVTADIPDYSIAVGIPAKIIKKYNFNLHIWESLKYE